MADTANNNNFTQHITVLADCVGNTPLVSLQRLPQQENIADSVQVLAKLEGNNPASSVKDRPAFNMIFQAEKRGEIKPGDTLIEATSGNTGIALAMVAAMRGYEMILLMPTNSTQERKDAMAAYGATLIEVDDGIEAARDQALQLEKEGRGIVLNQFANPDNSEAHYLTTGPELWQQTQGRITHFISSMGTTGTISGTGKYLKEQNPNIQIIGLQPTEEASIAGIRRWAPEYRPEIYDASVVDRIMDVSQLTAEIYMRKLARAEGILAGVSSGAAAWAALQVAAEIQQEQPDAVIAFIVCDRGDRYLSTGLYTVAD
jgi:cysteine synthase B